MTDIHVLPTLEQYKERLERHDWMFEYTDDTNVWHKGRVEHLALRMMARDRGPLFKQAFNEAYARHTPESSFVPFPEATRPPRYDSTEATD
jgi:hypothetical protein